MALHIGDKIPSFKFKYLDNGSVRDIDLDDILSKGRVVIFGLPGAFTPVCSSTHVPGFVKNSAQIRARGVDEIVCVSVNDPFVMHAWELSMGIKGEVRLLGDWDGSFTRAFGMAMDGSPFGLGTRSMRYAMIVDEGTLTNLAVDENAGSCSLSSAEHMLEDLL